MRGETSPLPRLDTHGTIAVAARNVSKIFPGKDGAFRALDDVSVDIREGEFFTLLGPSGCGKTTLLRLIAGFEHPSAGAIELGGVDISDLPPYKRPVNTVFQSYALFPHLTVAQNIAFGLEMLGRPKAEIAATVDRMLDLVKMTAMRDRQVAQISGGQQQRVALARALAPQPKVLLLDEPLSALDLKLRKEMQIELKRLQTETGITFVFVTHDQEEALTMSDRIAVMKAGKILQIGGPRDIYDAPADRFVASFIGETNFLTAKVERAADGRVTLVLPGGVRVGAPGLTRTGQVSVVIRPEHVRLTAPDADGAMRAVAEEVIYFGTDTHFRLRLPAGEIVTARIQNAPDGEAPIKTGDAVGITFAPGAVRLLAD
ncbi:MAG: spermidine/putrescine transport system ATP-binding protein [Paracoccaceae bacterium]|jgi:spermidine/putrescine transport system ATP-binding protein